jgi:hypothetical protein
MSGVVNAAGGDVENSRTNGSQAGATAMARSAERHSVAYQVILRHLAKFRDGATSLLDILATHALAIDLERTVPDRSTAFAPAAPRSLKEEPESPLELRIERHMSRVDRALRQIQKLNPERRQKLEYPPVVRDQIITKERTIHDIVGAELHFWAAAIENSPLDKFDHVERAWVRRIIHLGNIIGVDAEHKEHLEFLEDWASRDHS